MRATAVGVLVTLCVCAACCVETAAFPSEDDRETTSPVIDLENVDPGEIVYLVDGIFRSNPARYVYGLPSDALHLEEFAFGPVHKTGVHMSVLESCPAILRHLDHIGDEARQKRHLFALTEDRRDAFLTESTWNVEIRTATPDPGGWLLNLTATLGQRSELKYPDTESVEPEFRVAEQWQLAPDGPVLLKRVQQFSQKTHCAPYRRLPLTIRQLARDLAWAKQQPTPPDQTESPLERLHRVCGPWLNDDLTVIPRGYARNADVDHALRQRVIREASATWRRQIDQLKSCTIAIHRELTQWPTPRQSQRTTTQSDYRVVHDLGGNNSLVETSDEYVSLIISNDNYWFSVTRPQGPDNRRKVLEARPRKSDTERSLFGTCITPAIEPYLVFEKPLPDVLNDPEAYLWAGCRSNSDGLVEVVLHKVTTGSECAMTLHFDPHRDFALLNWKHARDVGGLPLRLVYEVSNVLDDDGLIVARRKRHEQQGQPAHLVEDSFRMTPSRSDPDMFRLSTYGYPEWPDLWPNGKPPEYLQPDQIADSSPL